MKFTIENICLDGHRKLCKNELTYLTSGDDNARAREPPPAHTAPGGKWETPQVEATGAGPQAGRPPHAAPAEHEGTAGPHLPSEPASPVTAVTSLTKQIAGRLVIWSGVSQGSFKYRMSGKGFHLPDAC